MSLIYISDTNIWIDFRNAGLLEQMFRLPFTLCCTDFVMQELADFPHEELLDRGLSVESFDESGLNIKFSKSCMPQMRWRTCWSMALDYLTANARLGSHAGESLR
jgi:hypothetical protein